MSWESTAIYHRLANELVRERLGCPTPAESRSADGSYTPNFELYVDGTETSGLADLLVASLAVLGAHTRSLVLQASEGGLSAVGG